MSAEIAVASRATPAPRVPIGDALFRGVSVISRLPTMAFNGPPLLPGGGGSFKQ